MNITTKKYIAIAVLAAIAIVVAIIAFVPHSSTPSVPVTLKSYSSAAYGFSFSYPDTYLLTEQTSTPVIAGAPVDVITLTRKADLPLAQNSEAAPAITIASYPFPASTTLSSWLVANGGQTNYTLPNTATSATLIAGNVPAIAFLWEGLYRGLSIAFTHNKNAVIFTGTYNNPSDQIVKDFENIIASIKTQ